MKKSNVKIFKSDNYNFVFNKQTGAFARWGKRIEDDPEYAPLGAEILDIEISSGFCKGNCPWCYKANDKSLPIKYMTLETYKKVFQTVNTNCLTQIAFGITDIDANPDFWDIIEYTREQDIIPNYTTNGIGITKDIAEKTKKYCGAVAVSCYSFNRDDAYDAIKLYSDAGIAQVNIHFMLSKETYNFAYQVLDDIEYDSRLKGVRAIVFLQYKDKNPNSKFNTCSFEQSSKLINYCLDRNLNFGFDSCSSSVFLKTIIGRSNENQLASMVDNCESSLFSFYINVEGKAFPCSFLEGVGNWVEGIDILSPVNYNFWNSERVVTYRNKLLKSSSNCVCALKGKCRSCMEYDINTCKGE